MTKAKDIEVYHVTCPKCGKLNQKTFKAESFIKCSNCKHDFYTNVDVASGIMMTASKRENSDPRERLLAYAQVFEELKEECMIN